MIGSQANIPLMCDPGYLADGIEIYTDDLTFNNAQTFAGKTYKGQEFIDIQCPTDLDIVLCGPLRDNDLAKSIGWGWKHFSDPAWNNDGWFPCTYELIGFDPIRGESDHCWCETPT